MIPAPSGGHQWGPRWGKAELRTALETVFFWINNVNIVGPEARGKPWMRA
jgi:hypothetical protein